MRAIAPRSSGTCRHMVNGFHMDSAAKRGIQPIKRRRHAHIALRKRCCFEKLTTTAMATKLENEQ